MGSAYLGRRWRLGVVAVEGRVVGGVETGEGGGGEEERRRA